MKKCDVIIPVYNAPEYVDMCLFALFQNTNEEDLGTVFLLDDKNIAELCSNGQRKNAVLSFKLAEVEVFNKEKTLTVKGFKMT